MSTAETNKELVRAAFAPWEGGDSRPFFELITDDVHWVVIGSTAASGTFESKQALIDGAFAPLLAHLEGPFTTCMVDVAADGDRVFLRFESTGDGTNGVSYEQAYCWAMRMHEGCITEIVVYLDTDLLARVLA